MKSVGRNEREKRKKIGRKRERNNLAKGHSIKQKPIETILKR